MKTLQSPFAVSSAPLSKCRALFDSIVMNNFHFDLDSVIYTYTLGEFIVCFTYEEGKKDVIIRFSKPFSSKIVQTSINELDCPNQQAQVDYLKHNLDILINNYRHLL